MTASVIDEETPTCALGANPGLLAAILDSLPAEIAVIDRQGVVRLVNRAWTRFAAGNGAVMPQVLRGANYLEVCRRASAAGDAVAAEALRRLQAVLDGTAADCVMEYPCHAPDAERWFVMHACRLPTDEGGLVVSHLDITRRRRAEEQLRDDSRRKDEFLAMLAHELRNPLAPIRSAVEVMRARPDEASLARRCHDVIDRQVSQIVRLLDDLLEVTRFACGHVTLRREVVTLHDVLELAVETARPQIEQRRQRLHMPEVDPTLALRGDKSRLTQVFANLLNNAAKYSHEGGCIAIDVRPLAGAAEVGIRDEGIGIARSMLGGVFELFAQAPEARRHAPGGLGVGLSLARRLVEMHGGSIRVVSAGVGRGSEFIVRLPLQESTPVRAVVAASQAPGAALQARVLVVDDNADAADTMALLLSALGCEVRAAHDGGAALDEADQFLPDLILLDLGMPGLDGHATCHRLRQRPGGMHAAIVAVTGWGQEEDRRRSAMAGFDDHLVKPVSADALARLVETRSPRDAARG